MSVSSLSRSSPLSVWNKYPCPFPGPLSLVPHLLSPLPPFWQRLPLFLLRMALARSFNTRVSCHFNNPPPRQFLIWVLEGTPAVRGVPFGGRSEVMWNLTLQRRKGRRLILRPSCVKNTEPLSIWACTLTLSPQHVCASPQHLSKVKVTLLYVGRMTISTVLKAWDIHFFLFLLKEPQSNSRISQHFLLINLHAFCAPHFWSLINITYFPLSEYALPFSVSTQNNNTEKF